MGINVLAQKVSALCFEYTKALKVTTNIIIIVVLLLLPLVVSYVVKVNSNYYGFNLSNQNPLDFKWSSIHGDDYDFEQWRGEFALVFFGYLRCSDYCPSRLAQLRDVGKQLASDNVKNVDILFFTVDPENDSKKLLQTFVDDYPNMQSGYIDEKTLVNITNQLKEKIRMADNQVSHSANLYLVNRHRKAIKVYNSTQLSVEKLMSDIKVLSDI